VFNSGVVDATKIFIMAQLKAWSWTMFRYKRV